MASEGRAGGLCLLWNGLFDINVDHKSRYMIVCSVLDKKKAKYLNVCCTYGAPKREDKLSYIDRLFTVIKSLPSEPWLVIGDLNLTLHPHEKEGGVWTASL